METAITDSVMRVCPVKLSEEELSERSQRMSEKKLKQTELEEKAKKIAKDYKTEIEGLNLEVGSLARIIKDKSEDRNLECVRLYHSPAEGRTCVIRPDTAERLDERDMTESEKKDYELRLLKSKQQELPIFDKEKEEPPKLTCTTGTHEFCVPPCVAPGVAKETCCECGARAFCENSAKPACVQLPKKSKKGKAA